MNKLGYKSLILRGKNVIKLFCDRCGERITDKYYTVAFTEHYVDSKHRATDTLEGTIAAYSTYIEPTALEKLNSQKMYCSECKNKLEYK